MPNKHYPDGTIVPGTTWSAETVSIFEACPRQFSQPLSEDAALAFSHWQRQETVLARRLRLIERWRYKRFLDWLGSFESGKAPYGVKQ